MMPNSSRASPFARLYVFPFGTLLQEQFSLAIEYVQVDYGMQQFASVMAFAPCRRSGDIAFLIYDGEHFFVVVACHIQYFFNAANIRIFI